MKKCFILCIALAALRIMPANAGERVDLLFTNRLDEEIVTIRVRYTSAYEGEEPRRSSSHVNLPPGAENWRTGVQGVTLPESIIFDLVTKSYVFDDLSGLNPSNEMFLEAAYEDGRPVLRRTDGDEPAEIQGEERAYLTAANRPNAVDRDFLTSVTTAEELGELLRETVSSAREESEETATLAETVFGEDDGWGQAAYFPVFWQDWIGVAQVQPMDEDNEDEGIGFDLRFQIPESGPENGVEEMLDSLLSDLRVDGFRPWRFAMRTWDRENDEPGEDTDLVFNEMEGDKYDHQDAMQERLFAAYADGSLAEASATWVREEAFDALKSGEEPSAMQGVLVMFSRGTFEALFVPNGRTLME